MSLFLARLSDDNNTGIVVDTYTNKIYNMKIKEIIDETLKDDSSFINTASNGYEINLDTELEYQSN